MKSRAKNAVVLCLIVAVEVVAMSTGRAAPQLLKVNWICASGSPCSGGFPTSNTDSDVGLVRLHFNVVPGTPDGTYGWSYVVDGAGGGSYTVDVDHGAIAGPSGGSYWDLFAVPAQYVSASGASYIVTVTGGANAHPHGVSAGFVQVNGDHYCCCAYGCSPTVTYTQTIEVDIGEGFPDENQTRECDLNTGCSTCSTEPMASYSIHLMLASLHIEDTPISYNSPRGPSTKFKVTYNQREANQPTSFAYGNLGPKWTFNWLSYVTDNGPAAVSASPAVYVRGGGTEVFGGYDSGTQSYAPDRQTLAVLVRTSTSTYERNFSNGSKEVFSQSDDSPSYPRRIFLTSVVDATGNSTTVTYDDSFRIRSITDSLGQSTNVTYGLTDDPLKITRVTDPFGRFATFEYTSGNLSKITDPIGIESAFGYATGSDFIDSMTTPYGTSTFAKGESGTGMRWLEATDPLGGRERVEYNNAALNIASAEASAPPGVYNNGLQFRNTFYWDKKAMADAPGDYAKAQLFHWLVMPEGKLAGIKHSEKKALESRVWYTYADQTDPTKVGRNALPAKVARLVEGGATQLSQSTYNPLGNLLSETDPAGRVKSYLYDPNNIDVLEIYQRNPTGASLDPDGQHADKIAAYTYNALHEPLTESDAAGQVTTYTYNNSGQILTRTNAKNEATTYSYGGTVPAGYLASITSPLFNGVSAVTSFGYDSFRRVQKVTNEADQSTVVMEYDSLDRKITIAYPDKTYEQFQYIDSVTGVMTLDLTGSRDRTGRWTYRHYDGNRKMDSMTDPLGRTTRFGWCICGSLNSIIDPNRNVTTFNRDLESRVYQKVFPDLTTINYLFEGQTTPNTAGTTSRLKSSTDALNRRTNYSYFIDNRVSQISYTDSSGNPLNPPTPSVDYNYDANHNRVLMMTDGTGLTTYAYYPVNSSPGFGAGKLESVDGPLANDTITFAYDELGRIVSQSINGTIETASYDSLGRLTTTRNALGKFERAYDGVTQRLHTPTSRNGPKTNYSYYGNDHDRRLQSLRNLAGGAVDVSKFDYTYNAVGQITNWDKLLGTASSGLWFDYDDAEQLVSARNASSPSLASGRYDYGYDDAGNRMSDSDYDPRPVPSGGWLAGTFTTYTANVLNQLDTRMVQLNNGTPVASVLIYDLAGNLIDDGERMSLEWDAANRLVAVNYTDTAKRSEFTYDGLNRRVKIVEKNGTTVMSTKKFVWVGSRIAQERDVSDAITRRYFAEGEQQSGAGEGIQSYYYTHDHLGSIREVTNSAGEVLARYDYDPYGKRTILPSKVQVDFGYTGHYYHAPSGLNLTLYRAYNPNLGRWISRDPIEERGGLNLYGYVGNDPVNAIDPVGLIRIYGNWCGPDWTGGHREAYAPRAPGYYQAPINTLDAACEIHDICYYQCRNNYPCDGEMRSQCFRECDRALTNAGNLFGGFWGRTIALAIDRPGKRDPERDDASCCRSGK